MHETYADQGFAVLGFPCNQFGAQEPGSNAEVLEFASSKYKVSFPMFAKVEVNGPDTCDLYEFLKAGRPGDIAWNFTKFLVDGKGAVIERFEPKTTPEEIEPRIKALLG